MKNTKCRLIASLCLLAIANVMTTPMPAQAAVARATIAVNYKSNSISF